MKHVIVTGANGFIGSSLIKNLIKKNIQVEALDISFEKSRLPKTNLINEIETDLKNIEDVISKISGNSYDCFYHLAWQGVNGTEKADPNIQINNINMVLRCAQLAKKLGVQKFLCAGTIAEQAVNSLNGLKYTSGGMMYGSAKYCAHIMLETYCKNVGLDFVWMQFSNIYGPENRTGNLVSYTIDLLKNNKEALFGPAEQMYDFIYVDDLISAVVLLGEKETKHNSYFIGSGMPRILKQYLYEIGEMLGEIDKIKIGERTDDGIKYTKDMFDISLLVEDIGNYITKEFTEGIKITLEEY